VLMELMDYLNEGIVRLRELEMRALSDGVRESIINRRKNTGRRSCQGHERSRELIG